MAITASTTGTNVEPIPAGNYVARCYQMIHIGTAEEDINGTIKKINKVRIGFELPTEMRVFSEEKGEQPCVISEEYTLSLHEKANLRKTLESWRGKKFTDKEAEGFDITVLVGIPCMVNIVDNPSKKNGKVYNKIASISPMPKGIACPPQVNKGFVLDYDNFDMEKFESLPEFLRAKIRKTDEFQALQGTPIVTHSQEVQGDELETPADEKLPF